MAVLSYPLFQTPVASFAFFILFLSCGLLWTKEDPPVLGFCLSIQWFMITAGFLYYQLTDIYPGISILGDIETSVFLLVSGLFFLSLGIRTSLSLFKSKYKKFCSVASGTMAYSPQRLFFIIVIVFSLDWIIEISPMKILFGAAQILYRFLEFRFVFLFLLAWEILRQRRGYRYGVLAFAFVLIPLLGSMMFNLKDVFFILLVALISCYKPWSPSRFERVRGMRILFLTCCIVIFLTWVSIIWEGGIKPYWRPAYLSEEITGTPVDKVQLFLMTTDRALKNMDLEESIQALIGRLSSAVAYFSHVLYQVPKNVPYEGGRLTLRALEHLVKPRIVFPEKANMGRDSWLVRMYAGLRVAGEESNTSVGLGYMPEFYIDFGYPGMLVAIFVYGIFLGFCYRLPLLLSPSYSLYVSAVTVIFLNHFSTDGELAKQAGGLVQSVLIFTLLLYLLGPLLHKKLITSFTEPLVPLGVPVSHVAEQKP